MRRFVAVAAFLCIFLACALFPGTIDLLAGGEAGEQSTEEVQLTKEQIEAYHRVYESPYVKHIRVSLNGYLNGTTSWTTVPQLVVKAGPSDEETASGLDSFSKDYYRSKFVVLSIQTGIVGGRVIDIIFQDKPDKVFTGWVYKNDSSYDLRGFWHNKNYTGEIIEQIRKSFKRFLEDKEHAL